MNESFEGAKWDAYLTTYSITVPLGDGSKTVYAEFEDRAGLRTMVQDSIILDTTKPEGGIEINNGTDLTRNRQVYLSLWAMDGNGIKEMMVSNYPDFVDGVWEPFTEERYWTLPNFIGDNAVYARFRDNAGLVSERYSDDVFLHTKEMVGGIVINDGDEITGDPLVTLDITLRDYSGTELMMLSNNQQFSGASWSDYAKELTWNLSAKDDGLYTVYVKFKDKYDIESDVYSDMIEIDLTPPEVNISSPVNAERLKNSTLIVRGTASDNSELTRVEVSIDGGPWIQMQDMENFTYRTTLETRGPHTVRAKATDTVGRTAETSVSFVWPKKKKTEPGFEGVLVLAAIALLVLLDRRRKLTQGKNRR
jgi:hypothetical protein